MPIVSTKSGSFEIIQDKSLLEALEKNGYLVEYQCRNGYCGACRLKLTEGQVDYQTLPLASLNTDEILPCCCTVKENISIEISLPENNNLTANLFDEKDK